MLYSFPICQNQEMIFREAADQIRRKYLPEIFGKLFEQLIPCRKALIPLKALELIDARVDQHRIFSRLAQCFCLKI